MKSKILYVEDNPVNMSLIRKMLRTMDYELLEAVDGFTGIQIATREQPDLIIMDVHLPEMTGWEASELLKNKPETAHMPIIILTADNSYQSLRRFDQSGCDSYLTKPVSRATLLRTIGQLLTATAPASS